MIKLKVISFFLCMLIALQMLPVKEIGKMLCNNQWTEELPHGSADDGEKSDASTPFQKNFLPVNALTGPSFIIETKARTYIHSSDQVPSNHSTDVVSPPPDLLF